MQLIFNAMISFPEIPSKYTIKLSNHLSLLLSTDNQLYLYCSASGGMSQLIKFKVLKAISTNLHIALLLEEPRYICIFPSELLRYLPEPIMVLSIVPPNNTCYFIDFSCDPKNKRIYAICQYLPEIFVYSYDSNYERNEVKFFEHRIPLPQQAICLTNQNTTLYVGLINHQCIIVDGIIKPSGNVHASQLLLPAMQINSRKSITNPTIFLNDDLLFFGTNHYLIVLNIKSKKIYPLIRLDYQHILNITANKSKDGTVNCLLYTAPKYELIQLKLMINSDNMYTQKKTFGRKPTIYFRFQPNLATSPLNILATMTEKNPIVMNYFEECNIENFEVLQIFVIHYDELPFCNTFVFSVLLINSDCTDLTEYLNIYEEAYPNLSYQSIPAVFQISSDFSQIQSYCLTDTKRFYQNLNSKMKNCFHIPDIAALNN